MWLGVKLTGQGGRQTCSQGRGGRQTCSQGRGSRQTCSALGELLFGKDTEETGETLNNTAACWCGLLKDVNKD